MVTIDLDPYKIIQNETGANARTKTNDALTLLETTINGKSETTHNHDSVYAPISHTHTASQVSYNSSDVNTTLNSILSSIAGMTASVNISEIQCTGLDDLFSSLNVLALLSGRAIGTFSFNYYFDQNSTGSSFTGTEYPVQNGQMLISKPTSGYNANNQQYLHVRIRFYNLANVLGSESVAHILFTKALTGITAKDIVEEINNNTTTVRLLAKEISSDSVAMSNLSNQINNR